MGASTTDHIYVNVNKLHIHLHLFFDLDSYSYELAQYPVWALSHNSLEYRDNLGEGKENA